MPPMPCDPRLLVGGLAVVPHEVEAVGAFEQRAVNGRQNERAVELHGQIRLAALARLFSGRADLAFTVGLNVVIRPISAAAIRSNRPQAR